MLEHNWDVLEVEAHLGLFAFSKFIMDGFKGQ